MKKYDCSKILDYQHESNRLCASAGNSHDCGSCRLSSFESGCCDVYEITQEMIDKLQEWSDTHPEKTNLDAMQKVFPEFISNKICPNFFLAGKGCSYPDKSCADCKDEFWNAPYEKPKEDN